MDYGKLLSRSWQITKQWKSLWVLGFLAMLGVGALSSTNPSWLWDDGFLSRVARVVLPGEIIALIVIVGLLVFLIGLVLFVVMVIAQGGLIAGAVEVEETGSTSFGSAWRKGARRFWTLLGIAVLEIVVGVAIVVVLMLVLATVLWIISNLLGWGFFGAAFIIGAFIGLATSVVVYVVGLYAMQAAIQEDLGWIDAFKQGWAVLKENVGATIVLGLVLFGMVIFLGIAFFILGLILAAGFAALVVGLLTAFDPGAWMIAPVCCGGLAVVILIVILGGIVAAFETTIWTLAYREMTGLGGSPDESRAELAEEPATESEEDTTAEPADEPA